MYKLVKLQVSLWCGCPAWNYEAWEDPSSSISPRSVTLFYPGIQYNFPSGSPSESSFLNISRCSSYRFVALNYGTVSKSLKVHAAWP